MRTGAWSRRTGTANETTITDWDPASKQPLFKTAAAALTLVERADGRPAPAPTTAASGPADAGSVPGTAGGGHADVSQSPDDSWTAREENGR
ncbi:hypothetical protein [Streptomyces sp. NBC_01431]|uniref:hypothetical protein n=1 Tax=Streptomyces sp. NBC_01431 TaxID=2903863 RepID=UPI002E348839|nr:hypothetical protein [Streptomyces sp. NBC_01431]